MIPEFQHLAKKVSQLATLAQSLRVENADLRRQVADLTERIQEAHDRVSIVLNSAPFTEEEESQ